MKLTTALLLLLLVGCGEGSDMTKEEFDRMRLEKQPAKGIASRMNIDGVDCVLARPDFRSIAISCDWTDKK
jgi:hypothetical protein